MTPLEELLAFAREFIGAPRARTAERKKIIRYVYRVLTGRVLGTSCATCYVEAVLHIIKLTNMSTSRYELKKGYVAQFDIPYKGIRFFTDRELTDDLAEEYLRRYPSRAIYFVRLPQAANEYKPGPAGVTVIIPPKREPQAPPDSTIVPPVAVPPEAAATIKTALEGLTGEKPKQARPAKKPAAGKKAK